MNGKPDFREKLISREIEDSSVRVRNGNKEIEMPGMTVFIPDTESDQEKIDKIKKLSLRLNHISGNYQLTKEKIENILQNGSVHESLRKDLVEKNAKISFGNMEDEMEKVKKELEQLGVKKITGVNVNWSVKASLGK